MGRRCGWRAAPAAVWPVRQRRASAGEMQEAGGERWKAFPEVSSRRLPELVPSGKQA